MTKVQGWIIIALLAIIAINSFGYMFVGGDDAAAEPGQCTEFLGEPRC
jgi:hypothetical protein